MLISFHFQYSIFTFCKKGAKCPIWGTAHPKKRCAFCHFDTPTPNGSPTVCSARPLWKICKHQVRLERGGFPFYALHPCSMGSPLIPWSHSPHWLSSGVWVWCKYPGKYSDGNSTDFPGKFYFLTYLNQLLDDICNQTRYNIKYVFMVSYLNWIY